MRSLILICVSLFSLSSLALETQSAGQITSTLIPDVQIQPRQNLVEGGFTMSSINDGSMFLNACIAREFASWFTVGLRGLVPFAFDEDAQIYGVQLAPRINVLNDDNVVYGEGQLTQGFFNDAFDTTPFIMMGVSAGYAHKFVNGLTIGVSYGIDYSQSRIRDGVLFESTDSLYNKLAMTGGYYF
jgi:hypothetical protein